jgi:hypothetical protein
VTKHWLPGDVGSFYLDERIFKIWEGEGKPGLGSYPVCNAKETEN